MRGSSLSITVLAMNTGITMSVDGNKYWYRNGEYHREDGPAIEWANGDKSWYRNGKLHHEDGPAAEYSDGTKEWYRNGEYHREDGPAIEWSNGTKEWYLNGKRHRDDGPVVERANGTKEWYQDGKRHRENGPAIEYADGSKYWYRNGNLHRDDGPAIERSDGFKYWYRDGELHREDGPAIEYSDGTKIWYRNGEEVNPPHSTMKASTMKAIMTVDETKKSVGGIKTELVDTKSTNENDIEMAVHTISRAREPQVKIIELYPKSDTPYDTIVYCVKHIKSQERIRITLPRCYTHYNGRDHVDWEMIHELKEDFSGEVIPEDVFLTIRHGGDDDPIVIVDIYHL